MKRFSFDHLALLVLVVLIGPIAGRGQAPADVDPAIHGVVERFFKEYAGKNLEAFMALWSEKSPDLAIRRQTMKGIFAETGPIELVSLTITRSSVEADAAFVSFQAELSGADVRSGKLHQKLGRLERLIELRREGDAWKIFLYGAPVYIAARRLEAASTAAERDRILATDKGLLIPDLIGELATLRRTAAENRNEGEVSRLGQVMFEIAQKINQPAAMAECHMSNGQMLESQKQYEAALDEFKKARAHYAAAKDLTLEGRALSNVGLMLNKLNRHAEALATQDESIQIARKANDKFAESRILNQQGVAYENLGKHAEAIEAYQKSIALKNELGDRAGEALSLLNLRQPFEALNRRAEAIKAHLAARDISQRIGNKRTELDVLLGLARLYLNDGKYAETIDTCREARALAKELNAGSEEINAISDAGLAYDHLSNYAEARKAFEECLRLGRERKLRDWEGSALHNLAMVLNQLGERQQAFEMYNAALNIALEIGGEALELDSLGNIANYHHSNADYDKALEIRNKLLARARERNDRRFEASTLGNIAIAYSLQGRYPEARQALEEALKIDRDIGDSSGEVYQLYSLSSLYLQLGQDDEGMKYCDAGLKLSRRLGDKSQISNGLGLLSTLLQHAGRYGEALAALEDGMRLDREVGHKKGEVNHLIDLANLYQHIGRNDDALACVEPALRMSREMGLKKEESQALLQRGYVCFYTGKYEQALEAHRASGEIAHATGNKYGESNALAGSGMALLLLKRPEEAIESYAAALKLSREIDSRIQQAYLLSNTGLAYQEMKTYDQALDYSRQALKLADELGDFVLQALSYQHIGTTYAKQEMWQEAENHYRRSISLLEYVRAGAAERSMQASFLGRHIVTYYDLVRVLIELDRPVDAFAVSEQARSRTLVEMIQLGHGDIHKSMTADERHEEEQLEANLAMSGAQLRATSRGTQPQELAQRRQRLAQAQFDYDAFRRRLYLAHPDLETERAAFAPATLTELNEGLFAREPNLCVLSYFSRNDHTFLFVLTKGAQSEGPATLKVYRLPAPDGELKAALDRFRLACQSPGGRTAADGAYLHRVLIAPAAAQLAGKQQLVIIADQALHSVPFHAFQDAQGKYVLENHAVSYAPSVTALLKFVEFRDRRPARPQDDAPELLAVGRPKFSAEVSDLPGTEAEVVQIAAMFGKRSKVLMGEQADETAVKQAMRQPRILHFATHGFLNETAPLYSSIALTKSEHDDGMLEARELLDLKLQAELTVLSACQTARGQEVSGEGVVGLTWSLFAAGSPSCVATLWSVSDKATTSLMVEFYRRLLSSPAPTKAEALRQSQLWLIREAPLQPGLVRGLELNSEPLNTSTPQARLPPYYWAAFQLLGEWR